MSESWHAIETPDHCERFARMGLMALGLRCVLPFVSKTIKLPRGKTAEILEPLWPGYVLCAWAPGFDRGKVWRTRCVERVVGKVGDEFTPATINHSIVGALQARMSPRDVIDDPQLPKPGPIVLELEPGQQVMVDGFDIPALVTWHAGARVGVLMQMLGTQRSLTVRAERVRVA